MTTLRISAFAALSAMAMGCSLPRAALGTPGTEVDGGGVDAPIVLHDTGVDAPGDDAWSDRDAYVDPDAPDTAIVDAWMAPDTNVDAWSAPDTGCTIGTTACMGDEIWGCDPDGVSRWHQTCGATLGCSDTPSAHCVELRASHVTDETLLPSGTVAIVVASGQTLVVDGSSGAITLNPAGTVVRAAGPSAASAGVIGFATQMQASGPELAIFSVGSIQVQTGGVLSLIGGRAVVLLASGDVTIDGTVDAGANGTVAGAGGYNGGGHQADGGGPAFGHRGDVQGGDRMSGGGGGGHAGTGGRGGNENAFCCASDAQGGAGGSPITNDATGTLLLGGSGGGGGGNNSTGGVGGGGGGALQITARGNLRVNMGGVVRAVGAGGGPGHEAGGGGGAGGMIFLEGLTVTEDGVVTTNGGGGGGGGTDGGTGQRGTDSNTTAAAGPGSSGGAPGGVGSAGAVLDGLDGSEGDGGGGGGGAGGRIFFSTRSGMRSGTGAVGTITPAGGVVDRMATIR